MHDLSIMLVDVDEDTPRARVALLLERFSELSYDREPGRIMYPLDEAVARNPEGLARKRTIHEYFDPWTHDGTI